MTHVTTLDLSLPFWSRVKLLLGIPLRVKAEVSALGHAKFSVFVKGEQGAVEEKLAIVTEAPIGDASVKFDGRFESK